ncbi:ATP-grasp fold amidoligase family protein [Nesterenkonia sp. K-15-9-6]|uniref:ATP-grasp fold amidoligase family protein n=1 Tax=Nesterenkonia sp. K-15-9-6 TaxID=3093918 RepID=UPI004044EFDA
MMRTTLRQLLGPVPDPLVRHVMYRRRFGRWGDFRRPTRFTEVLTRRMLAERTQQIAWTCDKTRMKEYAARTCPQLQVPATLWRGREVDDLNVSDLPERWIIKPNHASGMVAFGDRSTTVKELRGTTRGWLRTYDRAALGEWAYRWADHSLIVEPDLSRDRGRDLVDYKFYVFHGRVKMLHRSSGRFTAGHGERFYSPDWRILDLYNGVTQEPEAPRPTSLAEMIAHAEALGGGFGFMRVDFYEIDGVPWFGELTPYPSGGMDPFEPEEVDLEMGRWWMDAPEGSLR